MSEYSSAEYDFLDSIEEQPRIVQGSSAWHQQRIGKVTGSRVADAMRYLKNGNESADRRNYRVEKIAELLTGQITQHFVSDDMRWGIDNETAARTAYELEEQTLVELVGTIPWPGMEKLATGSPDGLVGEDGGIEIKCPKTTTHIEWMLAGQVPEEHQPQMQFYMACTGRQWFDFISYDPRLPKEFQMFVIRLERDEEKIAKMREEIVKFMGEVAATIARMKKLAD